MVRAWFARSGLFYPFIVDTIKPITLRKNSLRLVRSFTDALYHFTDFCALDPKRPVGRKKFRRGTPFGGIGANMHQSTASEPIHRLYDKFYSILFLLSGGLVSLRLLFVGLNKSPCDLGTLGRENLLHKLGQSLCISFFGCFFLGFF